MIKHCSLFLPGETIVVAVSGGADSVCLLHWLHTQPPAPGLRLHVAHLNHQLRGAESDADAAFVADLARQWELPATVESADVAAYKQAHQLTLEEAARAVRYAFLLRVSREIGATAVAVGHTADDQVETIILHWLRGAGLAGLRGMAAVTTRWGLEAGAADAPRPRLVRPLLDWSRDDVLTYLRAAGLTWREDQSNQDLTFLRNRIRHQLIPLLLTYNPALRATLRRAAQAIGDDYDWLSAEVRRVWGEVLPPASSLLGQGERTSTLSFTRPAFAALPPALQRGLLRAALEQVYGGFQDFGWQHLEEARQRLLHGRPGTTLALPHQLILRIGYHQATLGAAGQTPAPDVYVGPTFTGDPLPLAIPGETPLPGGNWCLQAQVLPALPQDVPVETPERVYLDGEKVHAGLMVRHWQPGDRFQPAGMTGTRKLQDYFVDAKVPQTARRSIPVVATTDGQVVWIAGQRADRRALARPESRPVIVLSCAPRQSVL